MNFSPISWFFWGSKGLKLGFSQGWFLSQGWFFPQGWLSRRSLLLPKVLFPSLLLLTACTGTPAPVPPAEPPAESSPAALSSEPAPAPGSSSVPDHSQPKAGGQVVEVGNYHLEFVAIPEAEVIHLDFYLQRGDDHSSIADATVTAQVQLPDNSTQAVTLTYDAEGEHYFGNLSSTASGAYNVAILTDIAGEKVNGRFNFTK
ncbi:hypothetical protein [Prochlorothrix hollandica]|uniref:hypothetical protein n=1 Tax=Prochlorothrix hollandica TaxID=1223 RepID=UPI00034C6688|nr:hypothetical protein [Prochlorothrix hollandica]